jgi:hypothetical protein
MRFRYFFVAAALLSGITWLLLENFRRDGSFCIECAFVEIVFILLVTFDQKWIVLAAFIIWLAVSIAGSRRRFALVGIVLASWVAMHVLNLVSAIADWPALVFRVCWTALLLLALTAPFLRRWRELAIFGATLLFTFSTFFLVSEMAEPVVLPNRWLQETGFRIYASRLIQSVPLDEFLSSCKLVDYSEDADTKQQVGECSNGLRTTPWFNVVMIYDPSGQLSLPAIQRTLAWRLAVLHLPAGRYFVDYGASTHLFGNFYLILAPGALALRLIQSPFDRFG